MSALALFRNRDFSLLIGVRTLSMVAQQTLNLAVSWQVYQQSGRAFDLGLIGLVQFFPALLLSPLTGSIADRVARRRIVGISHGVVAACALCLLALEVEAVGSLGLILAVLAISGTARAFSFPAMQSLLPNAVPREDLGRAIALSSTISQTAMLSGPALGGLLLTFGVGVNYVVSAVILLLSAGCALAMRGDAAPAVRAPLDLTMILGGVRFIAGRPAILGAISLDLFAVMLGGAVAMLPIYARDILAVGPIGLGLLRSAEPVGGVLVAIILAKWPPRHSAGLMMLGAVAVFGLATAVFGVSTSFALSLLALAVVGGADMFGMFIRQRLVQTATPDAVRGRVSAISALFINTSNQLGQFESGAAAAWLGIVPSVVFGGVAAVAVAAGWALLFPALRRVDLSPEGLAEIERAADEEGARLAAAGVVIAE